jgi:hypothetical protein
VATRPGTRETSTRSSCRTGRATKANADRVKGRVPYLYMYHNAVVQLYHIYLHGGVNEGGHSAASEHRRISSSILSTTQTSIFVQNFSCCLYVYIRRNSRHGACPNGERSVYTFQATRSTCLPIHDRITAKWVQAIASKNMAPEMQADRAVLHEPTRCFKFHHRTWDTSAVYI